MTDRTCNGWTNYATWRVNLEMFDGFDPEGQSLTAAAAKESVEDWLDGAEAPDWLRGWARAFLDGVNWQEIADSVNEEYDLTDDDGEG